MASKNLLKLRQKVSTLNSFKNWFFRKQKVLIFSKNLAPWKLFKIQKAVEIDAKKVSVLKEFNFLLKKYEIIQNVENNEKLEKNQSLKVNVMLSIMFNGGAIKKKSMKISFLLSILYCPKHDDKYITNTKNLAHIRYL